jgi:hypothetical protein
MSIFNIYPLKKGKSTEESVDRLYSAFTMMQKEFAFALQNIGYEDIEPEAINLIKEAIGSGRRVFVEQPVPPYEVGDLWTQGPGGDLLRCVLTRKDGDFIATDWQLATKYTNTPYAATVVVADAATSKNPANADFVVPAGSTDAQVTINAAIDSLSLTGGKVLLSEGVYVVDSSILLRSNVCLEGMGDGTIIKIKEGTSILKEDGYYCKGVLTNLDQINGNSNIVLANFTLEGSGEAARNVGILFYLVEKSYIRNLRLSKFLGYGYDLEESKALSIKGCREIAISSGHFEHNHISVYLEESDENTIINNKLLKDVSGNHNYIGIFLRRNNRTRPTCNNNVIANNILDSVSIYGISTEGDYNIIIGNSISNGDAPAILVDGSNNQIVSNTLKQNCWRDLGIERAQIEIGTNRDLDGLNNSLQNNLVRYGELTEGPAYGVKIGKYAQNTIVTNNDLRDSGFLGSLLDEGIGTLTEAGNCF